MSNFIVSPLLKSIPHIRHGFFMRHGGVSKQGFSSLNAALKKGDRRENVFENRQRIAHKLQGRLDDFLFVKQIHSTAVLDVTQKWDFGEGGQADAMITTQPQWILGVITADCMPILISTKTGSHVAAIHAGWKGAFDGIIEKTVHMMKEKTNVPLYAAIGPCIAQNSYEVGLEFFQRFVRKNKGYKSYFKPSLKIESYYFNLLEFGKNCLQSAGVAKVDMLNIDTYAQTNDFFSYRRTTHEQQPFFGCQASAIMRKNDNE